MDQVGAVLHNPAGQGTIDVLWRDISGRPWALPAAVDAARRRVLADAFEADLARTARAFLAIAALSTRTEGITADSLLRALRALVVAFPVYRCYGLPGAMPPEDARLLATALERANRELDPGDYAALDFLGRCLLEAPEQAASAAAIEAAARFQQLTTPVAAKAIEDTVFYREVRLLSRNEVGSDPQVFSIGVDEFHAACALRARRFPHGLLTTATHDHKRGEDVRARMAVLSDAAPAWSDAVRGWFALNAPLRTHAGGAEAPDAVDEFMLYQTLAGALPLARLDATEVREHFWQRVARWWIKAMRESKRHTGWIAPNAAYEDACLHFLAALVDGDGREFERRLRAFVDSIAAAGALNGLVQTFLRLTTPGVPDLYQGCDWWDLSLVDPDNRAPVDHAARDRALAGDESIVDAMPHWRDGIVKQRLIACLLRHRREHAALYAHGDHRPLRTSGAHDANVIAFERHHGTARLLAVASRWSLSMSSGTLDEPRVAAATWGDTRIPITQPGEYRDVVRDTAATLSGELQLADALRDFPCAMYFSGDRETAWEGRTA
jgi:(1->4)-alpha-D-glucan 1-alpha-D-glucosylmutase